MNDGTFLGDDFANAIVIANSGAGGDVDSAIFAKAKELNSTYKVALDFYRTRNHKYRQAVLENYDYDSNIVRSNEIHRGRLFMMKHELSEHSAQDVMRKRLKAGEGDNLDRHKMNLCYLGRLDLYIALMGVHERLYEMNRYVISEKDELIMARQRMEVLSMAACDLQLCYDISYFKKQLVKYVSVISQPTFGVKKETVIDENGDPILVYLINKQLNRVYISTVRVFMNGANIYRPVVTLTTLLEFTTEGMCWVWNRYVSGGNSVDCPAPKNSFHAINFHKCPRHPWVVDCQETKHREVQCPSLRQTFKPAPYDPTFTLAATDVPKAVQRKKGPFPKYQGSDNSSGKGKNKYGGNGKTYPTPKPTSTTTSKQDN